MDFAPSDRPGSRRRLFASLASLALAWSCAVGAAAAEVKVLTAEAYRPVVLAMTPVFEQRTGHRLVVVNDASGALARRIRNGEDFDLAVLPPALLEELGREGAVADGSIVALARAAGGAVYAGAVSTASSSSQAALSLLILLASEDTQLMLKDKGLAAP